MGDRGYDFNCMLDNFACFLSSSAFFFSKLTFSKHYFRNTTRVSNNLDPDQAPGAVSFKSEKRIMTKCQGTDRSSGNVSIYIYMFINSIAPKLTVQ